jgi:hypothetical protein
LPVVASNWPGTAPWVVRRKKLSGLDSVRVVSDLRKLTAAIMADRPEAAGYMAHIALGEPVATPESGKLRATRIVRMNPMVQPRYAGKGDDGQPRWEPYEWFAEASSVRGRTLFERLAALDMDAVDDGEVKDIERLAELWLEGMVPNQPVYSDDQFAPVIGQGWYAEALAAWRVLDAEPEPAPVPAPLPPHRARAAWQRFLGWLGRPRAAAAKAAAAVVPLAAPNAATPVARTRAPVD